MLTLGGTNELLLEGGIDPGCDGACDGGPDMGGDRAPVGGAANVVGGWNTGGGL